MATLSADARFDIPLFKKYQIDNAFDEMFEAPGKPREHYRALFEALLEMPAEELNTKKQTADLSFLHQGITFTVYGREEGTERIFPYDLLPRIVTAAEWARIERGLTQRITALNLFLKDIYHEGRILNDGVVPREMVYSCRHFRRQMRGLQVPRDIYIAVVGTDLIRLPSGEFVVLEDNLRVPSGVSYMLTNRQVMKRIFPALFHKCGVRPIDHYGQALLSTLRALAPNGAQRADHRSADSGRLQFGVFRTHVSGAADGHRAGGRPRSGGARQFRVHAHHGRVAPRGRDLPAHRRRFHRSAGVPARIRSWAYRDCSTLTARGM